MNILLAEYCAEMAQTKGSNSLKQDATGESSVTNAKEGIVF